MTRRAAIAYPTVAFLLTLLLVLLAFYSAAWADSGPPSPVTESGLSAWWNSGALAGPLTALVYVALLGLERLSVTRIPGLGWLRRGSVRGYLSLAIPAVSVLLPNAVDGSLTMGGLSVALVGGLVAARPGGGERKGERSGEIDAGAPS